MQQKTQKKQRSLLAALLGLLGIRRNPQTGSLGCAVVPAAISVATVVLAAVIVVGPVLKLVPPFASSHTTSGNTTTSSPLSLHPGTITEFPVVPASNNITGDQIDGIASGPDGNLWFTAASTISIDNYVDRIGHITPAGNVTMFPVLTTNSFSQSITSGPDGNLWFTESTSTGSSGGSDPGLGATYTSRIGRITPTGTVTEFPVPGTSVNLSWITSGPDGNLWFTGSIGIGRITPTGVITEFPGSVYPLMITSGPDHNLWFTEEYEPYIGRITPEGIITKFPVSAADRFPAMITSGPDGNLWFTDTNGRNSASAIGPVVSSEIGRITPTGTITEFPIPNSYTQGGYRPFRGVLGGPVAITSGPDGNLWFTNIFDSNQPNQPSRIGRITPGGEVTEFPIPSANASCYAIISGPDGNLWFAESGKIGRITSGK